MRFVTSFVKHSVSTANAMNERPLLCAIVYVVELFESGVRVSIVYIEFPVI